MLLEHTPNTREKKFYYYYIIIIIDLLEEGK